MSATETTTQPEPEHSRTTYADQWRVIASLFSEDNAASIQISSYNEFIRVGIPEVIEGAVIEAYDPVSKRGTRIRIDSVYIVNAGSPVHIEVDGTHRYVSPSEARKRKLTYSTQLYCNVSSQVFTDKTSMIWDSHANIFLADIPVMLKSCICSLYGKTKQELLELGECENDLGGYTIIKGSEKVIVPQERMSSNIAHIWESDIESEPVYLEIRSISNQLDRHSTLSMRVIKTNGKYSIKVFLPCSKDKKQDGFPLITLLTCYDTESPDKLFDMFPTDPEHAKSVREILANCIKDDISKGDVATARNILSHAILYNARSKDEDPVLQYLEHEILPHTEIVNSTNFDADPKSMATRKRIHIVYYAIRLLRVHLGIDAVDDRDDYKNKRVDSPGRLLLRILKQSFNQFKRSVSKELLRDVKSNIPLSVTTLMKNTTITHQLVNCLATGNWGVQKRNSSTKTGVSQLLNRMSYLSYLSDLRRVNASLGEDKKQSKKTKPRQLHITGLGGNCPAETPEGEQVGKVKNFAVSARITNDSSPAIIHNILYNLNITRIEDYAHMDSPTIPIMINGYIYGMATPEEVTVFVNTFIGLRRNGYISYEVSILHTDNIVCILTDCGRVTRPLFTVCRTATESCLNLDLCAKEDVHDWNTLVTTGVVEYVDSNEAVNILLAAYPSDVYNPKKFHSFEYTHCELHPSLILGVSAAMIPFADHNQSPRNAYQCLHPDTKVLLTDGNYAAISSLGVADRVMTFDPKTMTLVPTTVVAHFTRESVKLACVVVTVSGRTVTATTDHLMYTQRGFTPAGDLTSDDFVSIMPKYSVTCVPSVIRARLLGYIQSNIHNDPVAKLVGNDLTATFISTKSALEFYNDINRYRTMTGKRSMGPLLEVSYITCSTISGIIRKTCVCVSVEYLDVNPEYVMPEFYSDACIIAYVSGITGGDYQNVNAADVGVTGYHYDIIATKSYTNRSKESDSENTDADVVFFERLGALLATVVPFTFTVNVHAEDIVTLTPCNLTRGNAVTLYDTIGYAYNSVKTESGLIYTEYLNALQCGYKGTPVTFRNMCINVMNDFIFVAVSHVTPADLPIVSDITTESEHHCFVADSFGVHNSAMGKQAAGQYMTNHQYRSDKCTNVLYYLQKPLVATQLSTLLRYSEMPSGQNAIVGFTCFTGYNIDDSIIYNQSSIDRGMHRFTNYKTYHDEAKRHGELWNETFEKPSPTECINMKMFNYDKISSNGLPEPGTELESDDVIIGKTCPTRSTKRSNRDFSLKKCKSTAIRASDRGTVHSSGITRTQINNEAIEIAHVTIRSTRIPEIGDKFSSRHGQKGTIGATYKQQDMPFTEKDGITPDIIVNPHAIPSRMTIGQLIECVLGKACALDGVLGDGTPFADANKSDDDNRNKVVDIIGERLKKHGYEPYGKEVMYNPITGDRFTAAIFIGPTYYQRLKHMVRDKMHSRSIGPLQALTHQPVEGRAHDGGLRFGEMERDCMITHGASAFLKERLFDLSDPFETTVCKLCGLIGVWDDNKMTFMCRSCRNTVHYSHVKLPYACKLMFQELMSINIAPRIET